MTAKNEIFSFELSGICYPGGITIKLSRHGDIVSLRAKHLIWETSRDLAHQHWDNFLHLIAQCHFFDMPEEVEDTRIILDGSHWVLEYNDGSKRHCVERRSPGRHSSFHKCGAYLFNLSELPYAEKLN